MSKLFLHERLMKDEHKSLLLMDSLVALKKETAASQTKCSNVLKNRKVFHKTAIYFGYYFTGSSLLKWAEDRAKHVSLFPQTF